MPVVPEAVRTAMPDAPPLVEIRPLAPCKILPPLPALAVSVILLPAAVVETESLTVMALLAVSVRENEVEAALSYLVPATVLGTRVIPVALLSEILTIPLAALAVRVEPEVRKG